MASDWIGQACDELISLQDPDGGCAYSAGISRSVEPSVLSVLGIIAAVKAGRFECANRFLVRCANWLAQLQHANGAVKVSSEIGDVHWATAYALLLWCNTEAHSKQRNRAIQWLLGQRGQVWPRIPEEPIGHDPSIGGWPWLDGAPSWVEPTAIAILALHRAGIHRSPRIDNGLRLLRDRSIETGGWNYGNNVVLGSMLRPLPGPTGLVLTALAVRGDRGEAVEAAVRYLNAVLPRLMAPQSVGWGVLGLSAWKTRPAWADIALKEAYDRLPGGAVSSMSRALLILAACNSLDLFGLQVG